jgi:hypothetical protein
MRIEHDSRLSADALLSPKGKKAEVCRQHLQPVDIPNPDFLAMYFYQATLLQLCQHPADGFELHSAVAANFLEATGWRPCAGRSTSSRE